MSEHRFAVVDEPATGAWARPRGARRPGRGWRRLLTAIGRTARGMAGLDAYDRYVRHHRAHHPGTPVPSAAEFWRERWDAQERQPNSRCC